MPKLNVVERFDGAVHWAGLSDDDKATIGAAALEWIAALEVIATGHLVVGHHEARIERIGVAAVQACQNVIEEAFGSYEGPASLWTAAGDPRIPSLLGMVCEVCGCSRDDGCPEGCGWARDDLCTACLDGGRDGS